MTVKREFDLTQERVFLTGGGRGMGQGMARSFARWGATVGVADIDGAGARETAEMMAGDGGRASAHRVDVTDEDSVAQALEGFLTFAGGLNLAITGVLSVSALVDIAAVPASSRAMMTAGFRPRHCRHSPVARRSPSGSALL